MDDNDVIARIGALVDEEHRLESTDPDSQDQERIRQIEIALDQCWDLLRQRRARREAGQDPDVAHSRTEGTVEGYQQ